MSAEEILSNLSLDANEIPSASVSRSCSCHLSIKPTEDHEEPVQRPLQSTESQSSLFSELSAESDAPSEASATSLHSSVSVMTRASFCNACSGRRPRTVHEFIESQVRLPTPPAAASSRFDFANAKAESSMRSSPSKGLCTPPCVSKSPSAQSHVSNVPGIETASSLSLCKVPADLSSNSVTLRPRAASTVFRPRISAVPRRSMMVIGAQGLAANS